MGGREPDDLLSGLPDRHARITDGMARIGAAGKAACGSEGPLTERLVPAPTSPAARGAADRRRISAADQAHRRRRRTAGGNDHGSLDDVQLLASLRREPDRGCVQRLDPADDISR